MKGKLKRDGGGRHIRRQTPRQLRFDSNAIAWDTIPNKLAKKSFFPIRVNVKLSGKSGERSMLNRVSKEFWRPAVT
jgi:hypothetical protein